MSTAIESPRHSAMWKRYNAFLRQTPEITVAWQDRETGARAWLIINSLRGGAAGGGTRMHMGVNPREVIYLAKAMELKFALAGPPIGGAKCGIDFDNADPRKQDVLERWYCAIRPYLHQHYGTAGDLGVDEAEDVIPAFQRIGLQYPQEGIVRGHFHYEDAHFQRVLRILEEGSLAPILGEMAIAGHELTVTDMVTGYGVAMSIRRLYENRGLTLDGVRVLLEGFGNVGAGCALYLARWGARIVAISDHEKALIDTSGLAADDVQDLMLRRENRTLPAEDPRIVRGEDRKQFWSTAADVFVVAAVSGTVNERTLNQLSANKVKVLACGANQPFAEVKLGSTRIAQLADRRFAVIADILANCGRARTFSYLMEPHAKPTAEGVFAGVDETITKTLRESLDRTNNGMRGLFAGTIGYALDTIGVD
jgi:glutamate dehydrogenase/leucine dehydrogenase